MYKGPLTVLGFVHGATSFAASGKIEPVVSIASTGRIAGQHVKQTPHIPSTSFRHCETSQHWMEHPPGSATIGILDFLADKHESSMRLAQSDKYALTCRLKSDVSRSMKHGLGRVAPSDCSSMGASLTQSEPMDTRERIGGIRVRLILARAAQASSWEASGSAKFHDVCTAGPVPTTQ